jgi:hypothetical protein
LGLLAALACLGPGCADTEVDEVASVNVPLQVPPATYEPEHNLILPPPIIVSQTDDAVAQENATALAVAQARYTTDGWKQRLEDLAQKHGRPVTLATVENVRVKTVTDVAETFDLLADVEMASSPIGTTITIRQENDAATSSSTWRLRPPKKPGRRYVVAILPTEDSGTYDLAVDFELDVLGFGFEVAPNTFQVPGGPPQLNVSDLALADVEN